MERVEIVEVVAGDDGRVRYYANHNNDRRVWCGWSYTNAPADAQPEDRCPAECETSRVIVGRVPELPEA